MAGTDSDMLTATQNAVQAINNLGRSFPPITTVSSVAPSVGSITYNSSQIAGFGTVRTSSGGLYQIALLNFT